jgi:hypothetical protein
VSKDTAPTPGTDPMSQPLTHFDRGVMARALGWPADVSMLDDDEEAEYRKGYQAHE